MNIFRHFVPTLIALFPIVLVLGERAPAQWAHDPVTNTPVVGADNAQIVPRLVSVGTGGTITTLEDIRDGVSYDDWHG
mgnify:CR=1 FL=1